MIKSNQMILSNCAICGAKKSKFIKEQEAKGLLSNLCIRPPLVKFRYWKIFCFEFNSIKKYCIKILSYCLKCGESTKSISPLVSKAINGGTISSK